MCISFCTSFCDRTQAVFSLDAPSDVIWMETTIISSSMEPEKRRTIQSFFCASKRQRNKGGDSNSSHVQLTPLPCPLSEAANLSLPSSAAQVNQLSSPLRTPEIPARCLQTCQIDAVSLRFSDLSIRSPPSAQVYSSSFDSPVIPIYSPASSSSVTDVALSWCSSFGGCRAFNRTCTHFYLIKECATGKRLFKTTAASKDISRDCDDAPARPMLHVFPVNRQKRSFQPNWYKDYTWLECSIDNDACYCFTCRHIPANQPHIHVAFSTAGFNNWKNSLGKASGLKKHVLSQFHLVSTKNYHSFKLRSQTSSNVMNRLDNHRAIHVAKNRQRLGKICSTLHLLARQTIGFRGHDVQEGYVTSNRNRNDHKGSCRYRCPDVSAKDKFFEPWYSKRTCRYHEQSDPWRDLVSGNPGWVDFLSSSYPMFIWLTVGRRRICIGGRWVSWYKWHAAALSRHPVLSRCQECDCWSINCGERVLPRFSTVASVRCSAIHAGVDVLLKEYMPRAFYSHCAVHRLNLVISDTCKAVNYMLDYFGIVSHIHSFFTDSAVKSVCFNGIIVSSAIINTEGMGDHQSARRHQFMQMGFSSMWWSPSLSSRPSSSTNYSDWRKFWAISWKVVDGFLPCHVKHDEVLFF